jgi:membrane associated rhomboid family serine protease
MFFPLGDENPTKSRPVMTILVIAANVAVFVLCNLQMGDASLREWELAWGFDVDRPFSLQLLTYQFMHGSIAHILGNMWFLWIVGDNVEDKAGKLRYLLLYVVGGIAAALAYDLVARFTETSPQIMAELGGRHPPLVGASGAIAAIMGIYLVFFPEARIKVFVWFMGVIPIRAKWFLGMTLALDLVTSIFVHGAAAGGVATMAHVGGGVFGIVAGLILKPIVGGGREGDAWDVHTGFAARGDGDSRLFAGGRIPYVPRASLGDVSESALVDVEDSITELVLAGRVREAIDLYPSYISLAREKPLPPEVQIEIAHEFYRQWLPKEAIPAYLRYLETSPHGDDAAEAKFRLGVLFARGLSRPSDAARWLRDAIREHGDPAITSAAKELLTQVEG